MTLPPGDPQWNQPPHGQQFGYAGYQAGYQPNCWQEGGWFHWGSPGGRVMVSSVGVGRAGCRCPARMASAGPGGKRGLLVPSSGTRLSPLAPGRPSGVRPP